MRHWGTFIESIACIINNSAFSGRVRWGLAQAKKFVRAHLYGKKAGRTPRWY
jgi:hypothetical protein